jgi:hypothetical protein
VLPNASTLQKAANATKHWNEDDVGTGSSQIAVFPHPHAVSASTRFPSSGSQLEDTQHASTRQGTLERSAVNEFSSNLAAKDALPKRGKVEPCKIGAEGSDSTSQLSSQTTTQCLEDAAISRFQALVQSSEGFETSIEELSSTFLDAVPRHSIAPPTKTHRPKDSASQSEAISTSQHGSNAVGVFMPHDVDATPEGISGLRDTGDEGTSTCHSSNAGGVRRQAVDKMLLGESGEALKAVHEALQQVEDVQSSDELMHFEFCGPFLELSEV